MSNGSSGTWKTGACNYTSGDGVQEFQSDKELADVELFRCYSGGLVEFASACCVIYMLIGIPGNVTTIIALARYKKIRNTTAIFIINLHTSDLIFNMFILPMTAITFAKGHWTHGWVMCRLYAYFKFVLHGSSIFTVAAISIIRYVIVCHPLLYPKLYKRRNILVSILMIWASALVIFLPSNFGVWGRFDLEPQGGFCTMMPDKNGKSPKMLLITIASMGPYLIIALCYTQIWWVVHTAKKIQGTKPTWPTKLPLSPAQSDISTDGRELVGSDPSSHVSSTAESVAIDSDKTPTNSEATTPRSPKEVKSYEKYFKAPKVPRRRDKKLCAMIAAIMISFCMSHLPVIAMTLAYKEYKPEPIVNIFTHLLQYLGTCINPIIYVLMSKEYRQAYQSLLEAIIQKFQTVKLRSSQ